MKFLKFIMLFFMLILVCESYSQNESTVEQKFENDEAGFVVVKKAITIFKAISYIRYYPVIVYRIKNTGESILTIIYDKEEMNLEPKNSIDLSVENKDLQVKKSDRDTIGTGTYKIVIIVKK